MPELGKIAEVQMGYPFRSRLERDPRGDVLVIQMKDIDASNAVCFDRADKVTLPGGTPPHHLLRVGDLLFRSRGRSNGAAEVGGSFGPAVLAAPMLRIRPLGVLPAYLCWYLNSPAAQARLAALAEGTSVQMISATALRTLDVPLPSVRRQHRIADVAALAEREAALNDEISTLRRRLTTHLLTIRANEATP